MKPGTIPGQVSPPQTVILDADAVIRYRADVAGKLLRPGEVPVVTRTTLAELRGVVAKGQRGLRRIQYMPKAASELAVIAESPGSRLRTDIRGFIESIPGHEGALFPDGVIGATAIQRGRPLITFDKDLARAVRAFGGEVRGAPPGAQGP